jgi:integrase
MSIYKNKNKYWVSIYCQNRRYRKLCPQNTLAGAKAYEALLRQKLAHGEPITEARETSCPIPSFSLFSEKWFEVYVKTNNKFSEIGNKKSLLSAHLIPYFGKKQLNQITNLDIESYKSAKLQTGLSRKSVNNQLIVLNKCLRTARDWEVIVNIPKIKLLKVEPQKIDFLSIDECQSLLDNCNGQLKEMILLGLKTGLRFGELIALQWTDINFQSRLLTVQKSISRGQMGSPKSNKIRHIPLLNDVAEILTARAESNGFIFSNNTEPLVQCACIQRLHKTCERAGLRKIGWHTLRHTFASHLAQNGVSILVIKELLGHADIKTTMRYSHLTQSTVRGAIETLNKNNGQHLVTSPKTREYLPLTFPSPDLKLLQKAQ